MRGMQLVRPGAFSKTTDTVSSILRNTSCSHGWLRVVVQSIFAVIIVVSFVLIVYMAIQNPGTGRPPAQDSRCSVKNCKVTCHMTPFYGDYEIYIMEAVAEVDPSCTRTSLTLANPTFANGAIPVNWLSGLRSPIHELVITRGNLIHIPPDAFMSQFAGTIQALVLHNITISRWMADGLVGLSSLRQLYIIESNLIHIQSGALRAVDDTLEIITITGSREWNPANITGSSKLMNVGIVDFSGNEFHDVLGSDSFIGIKRCKVLYLNSCQISAIGAGAFDHLLNIEMLYLNNNYLVHIPSGLFANIATLVEPKPRINLQDNSWYCDCNSDDIRQLVSKDMLLIEPVCRYPKRFKGKTFSEFQPYCTKNTTVRVTDMSLANVISIYNSNYINGTCYKGNESNETAILVSTNLVSSFSKNRCSEKIMVGVNTSNIIRKNEIPSDNSWLKFSFFLQTDHYSIVELGSFGAKNYGLVWYEYTYPNDIYCLDTVPSFLRMYNVDLSAKYIFCPIFLNSGEVETERCVTYNIATADALIPFSRFKITLYLATAIVCLVFGAICVYALVRRNPTLLKGSKRILFVKHKTVDALVLPPKVPIRNDLINEPVSECTNDKIFIVPRTSFFNANFNRQKSIRSDRSNAPSYVSAHQPTDDQLAEWRIKHHFDNNLSITTLCSELSTYSWIQTGHPTSTDSPDFSLDAHSDKTYESLK